MRVSRQQTLLFIFASLLVLMAGAAWVWISRTDQSSTTAGLIPAPHKGFLAPDFRLKSIDGETIQLSELRGRPVMVNIWASWCAPCRAEMPALERAYQDYYPQGFEILAVNSTIQDSPQDATDFASEYGLTFPILFDDQGEATRQYQVQALPSTYFIDAKGIITEVVVGGPMSEALLRTRIENLLKQTSMETP